ncbi:hypothetical protein [Aromatoleum evansii]|uniref:hypothetical protein n=1 Tax=Aromatoleum evansii TaxID=59406 RepID=UPI00145E064F|nr:hypothetical protein [Aromatoleum evansii]NMG28082.1 hypothetical protein [Aromatoleum evansii]
MTHWIEIEGSESEQLIRWIDWLRRCEVQSFIELAVLEPAAWAKLREAPQLRRRIASILGWPTTFEITSINELRVFDIAAVLLNRACSNPSEVLFDYPELCHRLLAAGDFEQVMALAGFDATSFDPPTKVAEFVDYIRHYSTLDAWLQIDLSGVQEVCDRGWLSEIAGLLPPRPLQGWETLGGPVFDVACLVVARYLEIYGLRFCAPAVRLPGQIPASVKFTLPDYEVELLLRPGLPGEGDGSSSADARESRVFVINCDLLRTSLHVVALVLQLRRTLDAAGIELKSRPLVVADLLRYEPGAGGGSSSTS